MIINPDKVQTGRTTRMLQAADEFALKHSEITIFIVFPQQLFADATKKIRRPPLGWQPNLNFIGASRDIVTGMDFEEARIDLRGEGTFMAYFDHTVIEQQIAQLHDFASVYDAQPGQYGYAEPLPAKIDVERAFFRQIIDSYNAANPGLPEDVTINDIVAHVCDIVGGMQQIIDAYDNVPLRGRPADAPVADKVDHIIKILKGSESQ